MKWSQFPDVWLPTINSAKKKGAADLFAAAVKASAERLESRGPSRSAWRAGRRGRVGASASLGRSLIE